MGESDSDNTYTPTPLSYQLSYKNGSKLASWRINNLRHHRFQGVTLETIGPFWVSRCPYHYQEPDCFWKGIAMMSDRELLKQIRDCAKDLAGPTRQSLKRRRRTVAWLAYCAAELERMVTSTARQHGPAPLTWRSKDEGL